jgi:hypothetical protein
MRFELIFRTETKKDFMPEVEKTIEHKELKGKGIVSSEVRSYANDPFFVKKAEQARKTLLRVGLPDDKKK